MSAAEDHTDIVDRIAQDLPVEIRAPYYCELNQSRSLPENDERYSGFKGHAVLVTLLRRQVPHNVILERGRLERLFKDVVEELAECSARLQNYRSLIESRLMALRGDHSKGLANAAKYRDSEHDAEESSEMPAKRMPSVKHTSLRSYS